MVEQIVMYGAVTKDVLAASLADADVFILPTEYEEAFSLATAEALACGVPVIVSNRGALNELVGSAPLCEVVDEYDSVEEIARSCLKVIQGLR